MIEKHFDPPVDLMSEEVVKLQKFVNSEDSTNFIAKFSSMRPRLYNWYPQTLPTSQKAPVIDIVWASISITTKCAKANFLLYQILLRNLLSLVVSKDVHRLSYPLYDRWTGDGRRHEEQNAIYTNLKRRVSSDTQCFISELNGKNNWWLHSKWVETSQIKDWNTFWFYKMIL